MNLIITGATGFVAKYFIDRYHDEYNITVLTRDESFKDSRVNILVTDYSIDFLEKCFYNQDAILHLAARRPMNISNNELLENVKLDENIFSTANKLGIKNIVFTSSRSVYGKLKTPWKENSFLLPNNYYAIAKAQSEILANYYNNYKEMNIKVLRIAQVFGFGEYKESMISVFIDNLRNNKEIIVSVEGIKREYIYVKDLVSAFDKALKQFDTKGIFNLGINSQVTIKDIAEKLSKSFNKPELSVLSSELKYIYEDSLMDSLLFYKQFNWKPHYTFNDACDDIVKEVNANKGI